jgi:RimJ/RimL family protein N-acetyltransferase
VGAMEVTSAWRIQMAGATQSLVFRPAEPDRDAGLLYDWMHQPHVAPWWGPDRSLEQTRGYLERQLGTGHLTPWVVSVGDRDFGYVETYRAAEDPLAEAYPLRPSDRGWHVLVGPAEVIGRGLPRLMARAVLARLLSEEGVDRVVCEPDERNARMLAFCRALGHERLTTLDLGHKRAALLACTRDQFEARWPGDLDAGARSRSEAAPEERHGRRRSGAGSDGAGS